jgi:alpha-1,2-glucosyltransferase
MGVAAGSADRLGWRRDDVVLYLTIVLILGVILAFFDRRFLEDEGTHMSQIMRLYHGDLTLVGGLTTIPGYHACMAAVARLLGTPSLGAMRAVNLVFSVLGIGIYALLLRAVHGRVPADRLIQFSFFPIVCPYDFLVYTDVFAVGLVSLALLLALRHHHVAAALVAIASVLVRQNNVVWLVMIPLLAAVVQPDFAVDRAHVVRLLRTGWLAALGVIAFAAFVYWNRGVAIGDRESHPAFSFHLGNVYFFLALYGVLFLPSIVADLRGIGAHLRDHRQALLVLAAAFALYLFGYRTDHAYNNILPDVFLRNFVLMKITASPTVKVLAFVPMALALLDMLANRTRRRELAVVYVFTFLALVPTWLVEQRYYMIPFALLLLFRRDDGERVEAVTSAYYVATSLIFVYGIKNNYFFL